MADTPPDPQTVAALEAMHIEEAETVAVILAKYGMTVCPADPEHDEPTD